MESYIEEFRAYLTQNPVKCECDRVDSLLQMLFCCYGQRKGNDPADIQKAFQGLEEILCKLPRTENDRIFDITCDLCRGHAWEAFREGVLVGFHLYNELYLQEKQERF